jgi:hypothetical protein
MVGYFECRETVAYFSHVHQGLLPNTFYARATFPSSPRMGGRDSKENGAKRPFMERTGW